MAYEKEIKASLKNKYHADLGLSESSYEKVANILGATTDIKEEDIETLVNGSEGWLKMAQSEADQARKSVKKPDPTPTPTPGGDPRPKEDENLSELEKLMQKYVSPLQEEINTLKQGQASKTHGETLINLLTEKKIDPKFYAPAIEGREFSSQEEITALVDKISENYTAYQQDLADKGLLTIPKPDQGNGGQQTKATDEELTALADAVMK